MAFYPTGSPNIYLFREGDPAKWLINKDLQVHFRDFEPGDRRFESVRARHEVNGLAASRGFEVSNILWFCPLSAASVLGRVLEKVSVLKTFNFDRLRCWMRALG